MIGVWVSSALIPKTQLRTIDQSSANERSISVSRNSIVKQRSPSLVADAAEGCMKVARNTPPSSLPADEMKSLDDFRFEHRMPSRAATVRELMRPGLQAVGAAGRRRRGGSEQRGER